MTNDNPLPRSAHSPLPCPWCASGTKEWATGRLMKDAAVEEYGDLDGMAECSCCGGWCVTDDRIECDKCEERVCEPCITRIPDRFGYREDRKICEECR